MVDVDWVADHIDDQTVALIGSACNYGYGTVDPIDELCDLALDRGVGLHVDGCLGGFILPFGQELGYDIPVFDYRVAGGHLHLGRHPQVRLRLQGDLGADLPGQGPAQRPVLLPHRLERGQVLLARAWRARARGASSPPPGPPWSSSDGRATASYAQQIFAVSAAMQAAVRCHPELRILGQPTFLFSFTSDEFDIYHVNDFMRTRGWRFNGQQYPNALHMAVTRPQTQPGLAEAFAADLADAVAYAHAHRDEPAKSGAIYGGVAGGMTDEADSFIKMVMADMMDAQQSIPAPA